jgi:hypothetical protein
VLYDPTCTFNSTDSTPDCNYGDGSLSVVSDGVGDELYVSHELLGATGTFWMTPNNEDGFSFYCSVCSLLSSLSPLSPLPSNI